MFLQLDAILILELLFLLLGEEIYDRRRVSGLPPFGNGGLSMLLPQTRHVGQHRVAISEFNRLREFSDTLVEETEQRVAYVFEMLRHAELHRR